MFKLNSIHRFLSVKALPVTLNKNRATRVRAVFQNCEGYKLLNSKYWQAAMAATFTTGFSLLLAVGAALLLMIRRQYHRKASLT